MSVASSTPTHHFGGRLEGRVGGEKPLQDLMSKSRNQQKLFPISLLSSFGRPRVPSQQRRCAEYKLLISAPPSPFWLPTDGRATDGRKEDDGRTPFSPFFLSFFLRFLSSVGLPLPLILLTFAAST